MGIPIMGPNVATAKQMITYLRSQNPNAPDYTDLYLTIGAKYGIRGDLAFCQSILETGSWEFGGDVLPEQNNFAGLGATGGGAQGASFDTPEEGIEAQIQHLYAYANAAPLPEGTEIVDPRFDILERAGLRGVAPFWENLNGRWAVPGTGYGQVIVVLWKKILAIPADWKEESMEWLKYHMLITSEHDPNEAVTWAEFGTVLRRFRDPIT